MDQVLQHPQARLQNGNIPPELVDDGALDHGLFIVLQEHHGTGQGRKHAAPVDVPNQQNRGFGHFRHAHIDDVLLF